MRKSGLSAEQSAICAQCQHRMYLYMVAIVALTLAGREGIPALLNFVGGL